MPEPKLSPAAEEALRGPFAVEYHDNWPDMYHISGQVPGEDDEENTCDDERGRHDVRRRAVELLPEMPRLMALAYSLMIDADDRGELEGDDDTSRRGRELLAGINNFFEALNAAAAPHELEPIVLPPQEFRSWLVSKGFAHAGYSDAPVLNPLALFLEEKHGRASVVDKGRALIPGEGWRRTLPYMDRFLQAVGRLYPGPLSAIGAIKVLDEVVIAAQRRESSEKGTEGP